MYQPQVFDLTIRRGDTFTFDVTYQEDGALVDLTGYSARMQVRTGPDANTVLLDLSSPGDIALDASGNIEITVAATVTAKLDFGAAFYDLELTSSGGIVTTILTGKVQLWKDISRA